MRYLIALLALVIVPSVNAYSLNPNEKYVLKQINRYRISKGLKPTKPDNATCKYALHRVKEIKTDWSHNGFWSHRDYDPASENLAQDHTQYTVVKAWIASPTHNENLLDSETNTFCVKIRGNHMALEGRVK